MLPNTVASVIRTRSYVFHLTQKLLRAWILSSCGLLVTHLSFILYLTPSCLCQIGCLTLISQMQPHVANCFPVHRYLCIDSMLSLLLSPSVFFTEASQMVPLFPHPQVWSGAVSHFNSYCWCDDSVKIVTEQSVAKS